MNPAWCVLLPIVAEAAWAVAVLPRIRRNLIVPEDAPSPLLRETPGEMLLGLAWVAYHWPLLFAGLVWRSRRIPFWAVVAAHLITAGIYAGFLSLLAAG